MASPGSAKRYLLDTNICIFIAKDQPQSVRKRLAKHSLGDLAMSVITLGELRFGAEKSQARLKALEVISELSTTIPVFGLPEAAADHYGDIRARLQKKGTPIGNNDLWLAAHARCEGWTLVTHNVGEFARVPGLSIENWAE
jgi:tRNA(fMet)-specific endonuclease VapC